MTPRRKGFITLPRDAIRGLDHDYGFGYATRYLFIRLVVLVDHATGSVVLSTRSLATETNAARNTVNRHLRMLVDAGLVEWTPARNQELEGQLTIPGYHWWIGVDDASGGSGAGIGAGIAGGTEVGRRPPL